MHLCSFFSNMFLVAPTVKLDSKSNIVVQEGSNITLKCEANGIPSPNITWKRLDGLPLPGEGFQHWVRRGLNIWFYHYRSYIYILLPNFRTTWRVSHLKQMLLTLPFMSVCFVHTSLLYNDI